MYNPLQASQLSYISQLFTIVNHEFK